MQCYEDRGTIQSPQPSQPRDLQIRNEALNKELAFKNSKIQELDNKIQSMMFENDKMIRDYESCIDKISIDKDRMKNMESLVVKLEKDKEYLEDEIEKVRAIKLMLENQLTSYSDNAEIRRLKSDNDKLLTQVMRMKSNLGSMLGYAGDPTRLDMQQLTTEIKTRIVSNGGGQNEYHQLKIKNDELQSKLRYLENDIATQKNEYENVISSIKQDNASLKVMKMEGKNNDSVAMQQMTNNIQQLQAENSRLKNSLSNIKSTISNPSMNNAEVIELKNRLREYENSNDDQLKEVNNNLLNEVRFWQEKSKREEERNNDLQTRLNVISKTHIPMSKANNDSGNRGQPVNNSYRGQPQNHNMTFDGQN